ncbi:MAG: helix-turn-helix domain-containing protein [Sphingomonadaceae bacterium]
MEEIALSISRTAKMLGVGRSTIYMLIKSKRLDAIKIGTRTLITTESVNRMVQPSPDI